MPHPHQGSSGSACTGLPEQETLPLHLASAHFLTYLLVTLVQFLAPGCSLWHWHDEGKVTTVDHIFVPKVTAVCATCHYRGNPGAECPSHLQEHDYQNF